MAGKSVVQMAPPAHQQARPLKAGRYSFDLESEEKKYTDVFKSGGNILGQSDSKR